MESLKCTAIAIWNEEMQQDKNITWGLGTVSDSSKVSNSSWMCMSSFATWAHRLNGQESE